MKFQNWGEESFVKFLIENFPAKDGVVGIGDDCAVIPAESGRAWLVTTDALVEGVHFLKEEIKAKDLGYKTVAVNVSDIVAMGGEPKYAFLSIAIPKEIDHGWVCDVMSGIKEASEKWGLSLLGGDTVGSKRDLFLNLTLIGSSDLAKVKYRHKAITGDIICVTGYLGDSGGGLQALQKNTARSQDVEYLLQAHFRPEPHLEQGLWLASKKEVHAMMDISDGLDCDLRRLIKASKCGAVVDVAKIPISQPLARVSAENGWDALQFALAGGEDYYLLLTVSPDRFSFIQSAFQENFEVPLFDIGYVTSQVGVLAYNNKGEAIHLNYKHFDHFQ